MENSDTKKLADALFPIDKQEEIEILNIPPEKRRLHTDTYDFSIATIVELLDKEHICIPSFQRKYVWNRSQASRLIESLIIQCPIPVLYLSQNKDETLSVVDGNQRITSISLYIKNAFKLRGLGTYPELTGYSFADLDPRFQRHILNRTLRCIVILKETHPQIKFDVFERLNTGSVKLNNQELRHGIYQGTLISLLEDLVKEKLWKDLIPAKYEERMQSDELILRFLAFYNNKSSYSKPLVTFLNFFIESNRNPKDSTIEEWKALFLKTITTAKILFGDLAFRLYDEKFKPSKQINSALYDAQMIAIASINPSITGSNFKSSDRKKILEKQMVLLRDDKFNKSISLHTSDNDAVSYRINTYIKFLKNVL